MRTRYSRKPRTLMPFDPRRHVCHNPSLTSTIRLFYFHLELLALILSRFFPENLTTFMMLLSFLVKR